MTRMTIMTKIGIAALTGMLFALPIVRAAVPNPDAAASMRSAADSATKQAEEFQARAEKLTGDLKVAATNVAEALKARAAATTKMAIALADGDDAAIKAAKVEMENAQDQFARAMERLNVGQNLTALAPIDRQLEVMAQVTPAANKPLLEAVIAAKQKAVTAGNALLAAVTPMAAWNSIETARDAYIQSTDELELANRTLMMANARAKFAAQAGATNSVVAGKLAELTKIEEEMLAAVKTAKAQALQARILERKRAAAMKELEASLSKPPP